MPRPNSTGSSGKRKSSGSRSNSSGERTSRKSTSSRSEGNFSRGSRKPSGKPFRNSDSETPQRAFRKKTEGSDNRDFDKDRFGKSSNKPYKKFDSDGPKRSFRKKEGSKEGSFDKERGSKSFNKPFKKFDSDGPKKSFRKKEGSEGRGFGKERGNRSFNKPFKKFDSEDTKKSFRNEGEGSQSRGLDKQRGKNFDPDRPKKSFREKSDRFSDSDSSEKRSAKRPVRSFDKKDSGFEKTRSVGKDFRKFGDDSSDKKNFKKERTRKSFREKAEDYSEAPAQTEKVRLNRYIANSGVCSRREADNLITMGLISVNGKTITELGYKVNPGDEVRYESKVLRAEKPVYVLLNKPKGFLTTTSDPQERNTVMHLLGNHIKERIYPVGRLDRNTTGLLLLTNDGDLADKLMHPSYNVKKIYKVELDRPLTKGDFQKIMEGIRLEEGVAQVDDLAIVSEDNKTVGVELHIGWNRVVRRIFESLQYEVVRLDRAVYAGLDKKDLGRGEWRFLKKEEIVRLKHYK